MNNLEAEYNNIIQAMVDIWRHKSSSYVLNLSSTDLHPPGLQSTYLLSVGELILCFTHTHTHTQFGTTLFFSPTMYWFVTII